MQVPAKRKSIKYGLMVVLYVFFSSPSSVGLFGGGWRSALIFLNMRGNFYFIFYRICHADIRVSQFAVKICILMLL